MILHYIPNWERIEAEERVKAEKRDEIKKLRQRAEAAEKALIRITAYCHAQHVSGSHPSQIIKCQCLECRTKREILEILKDETENR